MNVDLQLGPMVLAVSINCIFHGTCIVQWYNYWTAGFKDSWIVKSLVLWVMVIDTFQTAATVYMLWEFTVPNFGNTSIFTKPPWPFNTTGICIPVTAAPIQIFLGYRIKVLSHGGWFWFTLISVLSLTDGAVCIVGSALAIHWAK